MENLEDRIVNDRIFLEINTDEWKPDEFIDTIESRLIERS